MNLEKIVRTLESLHEELTYPSDKERYEKMLKEKWVRLEDAEQAILDERQSIIRKIQAMLQDRIEKTKPTHIALRGITFEGVQEILRYIKDVELEELLKER